MATKKQSTTTKVRVLVEGAFGKPDDVIELEGEELAQALASGQVGPWDHRPPPAARCTGVCRPPESCAGPA